MRITPSPEAASEARDYRSVAVQLRRRGDEAGANLYVAIADHLDRQAGLAADDAVALPDRLAKAGAAHRAHLVRVAAKHGGVAA